MQFLLLGYFRFTTLSSYADLRWSFKDLGGETAKELAAGNGTDG